MFGNILIDFLVNIFFGCDDDGVFFITVCHRHVHMASGPEGYVINKQAEKHPQKLCH